MNIAKTMRRMPTVDMQISDTVPAAGEAIMDATSDRLKIGDGVTAIKDLPWCYFGVDLAKEESSLSLSLGAKAFLEDHIELIENNDYDTLYSQIATPALAQEVTIALLKADLDPTPYLSDIPISIKQILEPEDVWAEDPLNLYTKSEVDTLLDDLMKKVFVQMSVPKSMIKAGN